MSQKTWTVVNFLEEDTVEAVPTEWIIDNDRCLWPTEKANHCIKNAILNTNWPDHKVRIFRGVYNDYELARKKALRAEDESDLTTEPEDVIKKRKPRPRIRDSSDEDDDNMALSYLKEPPRFKRNKTPPSYSPQLQSSSDKGYATCNNIKTSRLSIPVALRLQRTDDTPRLPKPDSPILARLPSRLDSPKLSRPDRPSNMMKADNCDQCCSKNVGYIEALIKGQHEIKGVLKDIVNQLQEFNMTQKNPVKQTTQFFAQYNTPVNSEGELLQLNEALKDKQNFEDAVKEIAKLGGKDNIEFVKRSMSFLLTNKVASDYSWMGRRTKRCFKQLFPTLVNLILVAAEQSQHAKDNKQSEESIKIWLRRAGERLRRSMGADQVQE